MPVSDAEGSLRGSGELERSEERFRLLVESVVDYAIFLLDPDGMVQTWNSGAERLKGYTAPEIVGRSYAEFYQPEDREAGLPERILEQARRDGRAQYSGWRVRKDGTHFWADVVITALYEDGALSGFAKVTRDVTERHRMQQQRERALAEQRLALDRLERLDDWRREFVRSVVHDLQSPVTAIRGFTGFLQEDELPEDERRSLVERIGSNARSLQDLIDHLRTWAVLESGQIRLARQDLVLRGFVEDVVEDMRPLLGRHRVEVAIADDAAVDADPQGLERILRNLLSNAARHTTPADAGIEIRASIEGSMVTVTVEDEGEGLPGGLGGRVFDRFERGGGSGGTGLGLAIVKEYVELHGGAVGVESTAGEGARFWFTLPASGNRRGR